MDYKDILEGIVNIVNTTEKSDIGFANICSYIGENCPELRESEDDEVRKAILELVKQSSEVLDKQNQNNMINWLENIPITIDHEKREGFHLGYKACLEKQGEQKPADKVEPKFKVDDWVVYYRNDSSREVLQVYDIRDGRYYFTDNVHFSWSVKECDEKSHLWTIQDAEDGDVLAVEPIEGYSSSFVAIYKKQNEEDFDSYCFVGFDGKFYDGENRHSTEGIHPATKEQRDLLFQKMKEAGYEWDAEKKELRKVKKAPQKFMVGDTIKYNGTEYKITEITPNGYKVYALTYDEDAASLISFSAPAILVEQKPAWSEEDEDNFKHLLDEIVCLGNNRNSANRLYYDRLIKFIKELKNRAQPKEKWCDKDERMLDRLIAYFEKQVAFTDDDNPRYASWLKSLKQRYTWKPSDEQMNTLNLVVSDYYHACTKESDKKAIVLKSILEQLKQL